MPTSSTDRRVQKTRKLLKDALIALVSEKGYEAVTIQEILDKANVGRSTFYFHFTDKNDLMHSCFEDFSALFAQYSPGAGGGRKSAAAPPGTDLLLLFFQFAQRHHPLMKAVMGKDGVAMFSAPIHDYVYAFFDDVLKASVPDRGPALKRDIMATYLTSAFIGTLKWWIEKDMPCSPAEINRQFLQYAARGIDLPCSGGQAFSYGK